MGGKSTEPITQTEASNNSSSGGTDEMDIMNDDEYFASQSTPFDDDYFAAEKMDTSEQEAILGLDELE